MTNDEIERAIDFLLKSQANFDVRIEKTNEQLTRTNEQLARTDEQLAQTDEKVRQLTEQVSAIAGTQNHFIQVVTRVIEAQAQTNESLSEAQAQTNEALRAAQARTDEALARLAESQVNTNRRLDALIDIVQGGRGGQ